MEIERIRKEIKRRKNKNILILKTEVNERN